MAEKEDEAVKKMSLKEWGHYGWVVVNSFFSMVFNNLVITSIVMATAFCLYQYFIDDIIYCNAVTHYNQMTKVEALQFWMIVTIIIGFLISYWTNYKIEKQRIRLEIKVKQAESISVYANRMGQHCNQLDTFSQQTIRFKKFLNKEHDQNSFKFWANIFRKDYNEFLKYKNSFKPLHDEYMTFTQVHNMNYMLHGQHNRVFIVPKLFHAMLLKTNSFNTELDVFGNDEDLKLFVGAIKDQDLIEISLIAPKYALKISTVAGGIATALTSKLYSCNWRVFKATLQNPMFFKNQKDVLDGKEVVDVEDVMKFMNDA